MLKLRQIRQSLGWTVPQLARESGLSRRTIEDAERRGDCRISTAAKLAKALGATLDDLWTDEAGE